MTDELILDDIWDLYFHDPNDSDWTNTSYIRLSTISSAEDFWKNHNCIGENINKGIFFLMREAIFPTWDSAENIKGGCLSIKVLKENMILFWEDLCVKLLSENLLKNTEVNATNIINGISTSPKKHFCIIKIWLSDNKYSDKNNFNISSQYYGDILYKLNMENIANDNVNQIKNNPLVVK